MEIIKKHWKIISAAAAFVLLMAVIIFGTLGKDESEVYPDRPVNIFLTAGAFKTTSEEIGGLGFYTSTEELVVTVEKISPFDGNITLTGGNRSQNAHLKGKQDSYIFAGLETDIAYTITCEGLENCAITVSEVVADEKTV